MITLTDFRTGKRVEVDPETISSIENDACMDRNGHYYPFSTVYTSKNPLSVVESKQYIEMLIQKKEQKQ